VAPNPRVWSAAAAGPRRLDRGTLGAVKQVVTRSDAPAPSLPFSAGIKANGFVFTAGQVGTDPRTGQVAGPDVAAQTRQAIDNLRAVLEAGGSSLDRLVKTTVFLSDMRTFEQMNAVYRELIPEPRPGRSTVEVRLARPELLVEIEGVGLAD
jgi:2-iminobutanoate/2-iminopropanoate deaminase